MGIKSTLVVPAVVAGGNGSGKIDENRIIIKSDTIPAASAETYKKIYIFAGETNTSYTHGYIYECVGNEEATSISTDFYPEKMGFDFRYATHPSKVFTSDAEAMCDFITTILQLPNPFEVVSGKLVVDDNTITDPHEHREMWWVYCYDKDGNELLSSYKIYASDLQAYGFQFTNPAADYHQNEPINFTFNWTTTVSNIHWERINVQPAGSGAGVEWGDITGTLSHQTDLQSALNNKQDTLVSGTNIKTVNNQSLLGSGNIDIQCGSAPTFTTFTNKTGTSFDTGISGLDSKTVMVFKNGLLLEKGTEGVATKIYTGGYTYGLTLANTAPIATANSWEVRTVYTYNGGGTYPVVFGTSGSEFWKTPFMHVEDGVMKVWISSDGDISGAFILGFPLGLYPSMGETYYLKLYYDDVNGYKAFYSATGFDNGTEVEISSNTTKAFCSVPFMFLNQLTGTSSEYNSNGSINWTQTKITINGQTWFDGATAVENTDYTNYGCVLSVIPAEMTNDYAVSNSTISFATPLLTTDKITVGVF